MSFCSKWQNYPDSKDHGANMGPTWVLSAPDGPRFGPMNLAVRLSSNFPRSSGNFGEKEPQAELLQADLITDPLPNNWVITLLKMHNVIQNQQGPFDSLNINMHQACTKFERFILITFTCKIRKHDLTAMKLELKPCRATYHMHI